MDPSPFTFLPNQKSSYGLITSTWARLNSKDFIFLAQFSLAVLRPIDFEFEIQQNPSLSQISSSLPVFDLPLHDSLSPYLIHTTLTPILHKSPPCNWDVRKCKSIPPTSMNIVPSLAFLAPSSLAFAVLKGFSYHFTQTHQQPPPFPRIQGR